MASQFENDKPLNSPEAAVEAVQAYQLDVAKFQAETRDAIEECEQERTRPLDVEALKSRVRRRLAEHGVIDATIVAEAP